MCIRKSCKQYTGDSYILYIGISYFVYNYTSGFLMPGHNLLVSYLCMAIVNY